MIFLCVTILFHFYWTCGLLKWACGLLKFIYVVACISISFLFIAKYYSLVRASSDRHLRYFHFLSAMNIPRTSFCVDIGFFISFPSIPRNVIAGLYGIYIIYGNVLCLTFQGIARFAKQLYHFTFLPAVYESCSFSCKLCLFSF